MKFSFETVVIRYADVLQVAHRTTVFAVQTFAYDPPQPILTALQKLYRPNITFSWNRGMKFIWSVWSLAV
jgi:hypothetical protein